ncbi:thioredoxin-disulfide reductase [Candidatus Falkowbacteria bacterium]|nr:thioredoxin-disulfide reductase [Candidatus Falkowbacteria bacterium]
MKNTLDVIIIGGGISAHSAAIYNARASLNPLVIAGFEPDQLSLTTQVENYPGFPEGIMGPDLIVNCKKQAEKFGAKYIMEKAENFEIKDDYFEVKTDKNAYRARSVIISTGASARRLGIPGEDKYFGRGVSTCAVCDAAFYKDKIAVVVGGGDSAMEESLALYKFAKKITIIHRKDNFNASQIMQDRILKMVKAKDKIDILWNTKVTEVLGDKFVTGLKIVNNKTDKEGEIKTDGMFLAIGHIPNTGIFQGKIELDKMGYIITDKLQRTNVPGVFAAGDVQDHIFRQAATSAGTGVAAAILAERYLEDLQNKGKY